MLAIVQGCTDDEAYSKPPEGERGSIADWRTRKQAYVEHLERTNDVGLLRMSCADKLHNILLDLHELGDALWARFRASNRSNVLWYYRSLHAVCKAKAGALGDQGFLGTSRADAMSVRAKSSPT